MSGYDDLVERRAVDVGGVSDWYWLKTDSGAFVGPSEDWSLLRDAVAEAAARRAKTYPARTSICVQAGGCLGMYPRLWSGVYETVYTFEPDALNFHVLCLNNQSERVVKFNAALGDGGRVRIKHGSPVNVGEHQVTHDDDGRGSFMVDWLRLPGCDLIQLDVEGFERHAVRGAMQTIQAYRPIVTVETEDEIPELLGPLGYTLVARGRYDAVFAPR